jgi:hypothetical protein
MAFGDHITPGKCKTSRKELLSALKFLQQGFDLAGIEMKGAPTTPWAVPGVLLRRFDPGGRNSVRGRKVQAGSPVHCHAAGFRPEAVRAPDGQLSLGRAVNTDRVSPETQGVARYMATNLLECISTT